MLVNLNRAPLYFCYRKLNVRSPGTFDSPEDKMHLNVSFQKKKQTTKKAHSSTPRTALKLFAKDICSVDFKIQLRTQNYSIFRRALVSEIGEQCDKG